LPRAQELGLQILRSFDAMHSHKKDIQASVFTLTDHGLHMYEKLTLFEFLSIAAKTKRPPLFEKYLANKTILDVGCGEGGFIARDPSRITGIDLNPALIDACTKRGFRAQEMSALEMDFPANSFDAVHAAQLIEHFSPVDAARFIAACSKVLRPGGILYLTTPGTKNVWNTFSHIRPYPPDAFQKLLRSRTEGYIRQSAIDMKLEAAYGSRYSFRWRPLQFLSSILDLLWPPSDPIGWTIILRRND
jgi:SAM-dependent methyltransferase